MLQAFRDFGLQLVDDGRRVPGGAHMAAQLSTLKPGYTEATVGKSVNNSERRTVVPPRHIFSAP